MSQRESAFISFYDEETGQLKFCVVSRDRVQSAIDRALAITIPPDAPEHSVNPISEDDANKLGCMAILCHTEEHPELRSRLRLAATDLIDWKPANPPP